MDERLLVVHRHFRVGRWYRYTTYNLLHLTSQSLDTYGTDCYDCAELCVFDESRLHKSQKSANQESKRVRERKRQREKSPSYRYHFSHVFILYGGLCMAYQTDMCHGNAPVIMPSPSFALVGNRIYRFLGSGTWRYVWQEKENRKERARFTYHHLWFWNTCGFSELSFPAQGSTSATPVLEVAAGRCGRGASKWN